MSTTYANFCEQLKDNLACQRTSKLLRVFRDSRFPKRFFILSSIGLGDGVNSDPISRTLEAHTQAYSCSCWGLGLRHEYIYVDLVETASDLSCIIEDSWNIPADPVVSSEDASVFHIPQECSDTSLLHVLARLTKETNTKLIHVTDDSFVFYDTSAALSSTHLCSNSSDRAAHRAIAYTNIRKIFDASIENVPDCSAVGGRSSVRVSDDEVCSQEHSMGTESLPLFKVSLPASSSWRAFHPVCFNAAYNETKAFNIQVANLLASYLSEEEHITLLRILQKEQQSKPSPEVQTLLQKVFPDIAALEFGEPLLLKA